MAGAHSDQSRRGGMERTMIGDERKSNTYHHDVIYRGITGYGRIHWREAEKEGEKVEENEKE